jgi:hypothetical protein
MADVIREYIRAVLDTTAQAEKAEDDEIARIEAEGFRLVDGGQVTEDRWEISDFRSGEILAEGDGGPDEYFEAANALDGDAKIYYVGAIASEIHSRFPVPEPPAGLPESLAEALAAWVSEHTGEAQQFSEQTA